MHISLEKLNSIEVQAIFMESFAWIGKASMFPAGLVQAGGSGFKSR